MRADPPADASAAGRLRRVVLHIGSEKTGTTSIQEFLASNREQLRTDGILVPQAFGGKNHVRLALAAVDEARPPARRAARHIPAGGSYDDLRRQIRDEMAATLQEARAGGRAPEVLVLTNEHLHTHLHTREELLRLKDLLPPAQETVVVFYVRRQDRAAVSLYSTALKGGRERDGGFRFPRAESIPYRYDYLAAWQLWTSVFGPEAVRLRIFDRRELHEGDLLRDFCAAAGLPWSGTYAVPQSRNPSLDVNGEYVFQQFNRLRGADGERFDPQAEMQLSRLLVARFSDGEKPRPARAAAVEFLAACRPGNEELRRLALPERAAPLFDDDVSEYPEQASDTGQGVDHALICRTLLKEWLELAARLPAPQAPQAEGAPRRRRRAWWSRD